MSKANGKLKSVAVGLSVTAFNTGLTTALATHCTGSCQACGGQCLLPTLGLAVGGIVAYAIKQRADL
jgi:hypothetical protein